MKNGKKHFKVKANNSILLSLNQLWGHIDVKYRRHFWFLVLLMIAASFAEILSIGTTLPFLGALVNPTQAYESTYLQPLIAILRVNTPEQLIPVLTIIFCLASLFAGALRLLLLWFSNYLCFSIGASISVGIYRRTLYQPYSVHISRNSSEIISVITSKVNSAIHIVSLILLLVSSLTMLIVISVALFSLDPLVALLAFGGFAIIYVCIVLFNRNQLLINSQKISKESIVVIKSLQEGLGGIRDVLLDGAQGIYCETYEKADKALRRAQGSSAFIGTSPRYLVETLGMILFAIVAYMIVKQSNGVTRVIPLLGALALGAQRVLPMLQQAYAAWTGICASQTSLNDVLKLLDQPLPITGNTAVSPLLFKEYIELRDVSFRYSLDSPWILRGINLRIKKGARIGFIGPTGSGKSTILDLLMGLIDPSEGEIFVDGVKLSLANYQSWQNCISHVPQSIYLADATIGENIAFAIPAERIDMLRVHFAAKKAQIHDVIESWPDGYMTRVGERGVRLSGGQRQRIGIARALYKKTSLIVFDEATSALDNETEKAVIEAIECLDKNLTMVMIAHRLSTLRGCDQIIELKDGKMKLTGLGASF